VPPEGRAAVTDNPEVQSTSSESAGDAAAATPSSGALSQAEARRRNLALLSEIRKTYFLPDLIPAVIATKYKFISARNRIPLVRAILPLIPESERGILDRWAIPQQENAEWDLRDDRTPWALGHNFPRLEGGLDPDKVFSPIDFLMSLEYYRFFEGLPAPDGMNLDKFLGGIEDFLANDFAILEVLRLATKEIPNRLRQSEEDEQQRRRDPRIRRLLGYTDLRTHLYLTTAAIRIRAGWDKMANNVLRPWLDPTLSHSWHEKWPKRLERLGVLIQATGKQAQVLWADWLVNAKAIADDDGLRVVRDGEVHGWGKRTIETFGSSPREWRLADLERFVLEEYWRLTDAWLLAIAIMRTDTRVVS
jgi:hypothetical protein